MKLNSEIIQAIKDAIDYYGTASQFAKEIGVAHSTVLFWLSGKTTNISGSVWDRKVRRVLNRFMPKTEHPVRLKLQESPQQYSAKPSSAEAKKDLCRKVPAIPLSKLTDIDITMQLPVSFVRSRKTAEVPFANEVSEFSFALILDQPSFCPSLPIGSALLIGGFDYAKDGDLVVGKTRKTERLFFCRYRRSGNRMSLIPMNPELPVMEWNEEENAEKVFWIFPVKEISLDLNSCIWSENNELIPRPSAEVQD